jgi:hypothetical protein
MIKKYMLVLCLAGQCALQANPIFKEMVLTVEKNPYLRSFISILIESQSIPSATITALAIRCVAEAHIAQSINEHSVYDKNLQNYLACCAQEVHKLQSMPRTVQEHEFHIACSEEEKAFDTFIKAVHQRKMCQTVLEEAEDLRS